MSPSPKNNARLEWPDHLLHARPSRAFLMSSVHRIHILSPNSRAWSASVSFSSSCFATPAASRHRFSADLTCGGVSGVCHHENMLVRPPHAWTYRMNLHASQQPLQTDDECSVATGKLAYRDPLAPVGVEVGVEITSRA